jgi:AraC family transcriptional regulator
MSKSKLIFTTLPNGPVRQSGDLWEGLNVSEYLLQPASIQHQISRGHHIAINIGQPVPVRWKESAKWNAGTYRTGSFGIVPDNDFNDISWNKELHSITININSTFLESLFERTDIEFRQRRGVEDPFITQIGCSLLSELKHENFAGRIYGDILALTLSLHFVKRYALAGNKEISLTGRLSAAQLKATLEYCDAHLDQNPSLSELSQVANLSSFHFAHAFRQTTGLPPHRYILKRKIERAIQLIIQGKNSLTQIAYLLGHTDQAHFSKSFKLATGLSPRQYMKANSARLYNF